MNEEFSETDQYIQHRMLQFQGDTYPMHYSEGYVDGIDIEGRAAIEWSIEKVKAIIALYGNNLSRVLSEIEKL